jgi:hypothetical protein
MYSHACWNRREREREIERERERGVERVVQVRACDIKSIRETYKGHRTPKKKTIQDRQGKEITNAYTQITQR